MLVNFNLRIWSPFPRDNPKAWEKTQLSKTVELPYVPAVGMVFGGNRVNFVNGCFEKPNNIQVILDSIEIDNEGSLEEYTYLVESYIKEGWTKEEKK